MCHCNINKLYKMWKTCLCSFKTILCLTHCPLVHCDAIKCQVSLVNIGLGNGILPHSTKPFTWTEQYNQKDFWGNQFNAFNVEITTTNTHLKSGMSPQWPLLVPLSWCPTFKSSHCNSFEDGAPVDFIYGYPIFKCIAKTSPHDRAPGY